MQRLYTVAAREEIALGEGRTFSRKIAVFAVFQFLHIVQNVAVVDQINESGFSPSVKAVIRREIVMI